MNEKIKSHWPLTLFSSLSAVCNLALPLVLVRVFTTEEVGHYKLFFLYLALMPWISLSAGIGNGLYLWAGKPDFKKYFHSSWTILVCWSLFFSVLLAFLVHQQPMGLWFALGTFLTLLSTFHEEALIASGQTWRGGIFAAALEIGRAGLVLMVAIQTSNLQLLIEAYVFALAVKVLLGSYYGRTLDLQRFVHPLGINRETSRTILQYVVPVSFAATIAVFTHYADQLVLSHMAEAAYFAGYTLGCLTIPPLNSFEQAVNRVLIPSLNLKTPHLFRDAVAELAWILIPATAGLLIFADPIVQLIFTEKYAWVAGFLRLFSFNYLMFAFPYDAWPRAEGNGRWILKNLLAAVAVGLITIPALTYFYLGYGALVGLLLTQLSLRIGAWIHIRKTTDWKIVEFVPVSELIYQSLLCAGLAIACLGAGSFLGHGLRWLLICAPLFAVIYLSLTTHRRFSRHFRERNRPAVLQMTQYLEMGGLERVIYSLCSAYQEKHEIDSYLLSYDRRAGASSLKENFEKLGIPVFCEEKGSGFSIKIVFQVIRLCYRERIGVIHTHDLGPLLYAAIAKLLSFGAVKIVHTQHSFVHLAKKRRHRFYEQVFTRFADALVVISKDAQKTYQELGVKPKHMSFVSNGVFFPGSVPGSDSEKLTARAAVSSSLPVDRVWVLYLARIHAQKGQNHALKLWGLLSEASRKKSILIFVGQESSEGELQKLKEFAVAHDLNSCVAFAGMTQHPMKWLEASDAFISLSEFEGMPLSPIEAVGAGLPLMISKIPGHDVLPPESLWLSLSPEKSEAEKVDALIASLATQSPAERVQHFKEAQDWREHYGIHEMANQYLKLYRKVSS
jgi:glycosyltransferase involved in cell wall biosynthesis/O-antigen/teichoic acid export membrane protein